jgi:hypothetical protein
MQGAQSILRAILGQLRRLWAFWMADIAKRRGCLGKSASIGIGIFAIICACGSINLAVGNVGQRIGVVPTWTPRPPTATPTITPTPGPTDTPAPTNTREPTRTPRPTAVPPTVRPTRMPAPTNTPRPTRAPGEGFRGGSDANPLFFGEGRGREVDPPWYPCKEGQVKGNRDSRLYHVPSGSFYNNTYEGVDCFDTAADAAAAGYDASER